MIDAYVVLRYVSRMWKAYCATNFLVLSLSGWPNFKLNLSRRKFDNAVYSPSVYSFLNTVSISQGCAGAGVQAILDGWSMSRNQKLLDVGARAGA